VKSLVTTIYSKIHNPTSSVDPLLCVNKAIPPSNSFIHPTLFIDSKVRTLEKIPTNFENRHGIETFI